MPVEYQVIIIYAVTKKYVIDIDVDRVIDFQDGLFEFIDTKYPQIPEKIKETMLRHARLQIEFKGDFIGIREMRKHVAWYTKGMKGSAKLRDAINQVESYEELVELLDKAIV